jgi:hypothetical protein
MAFPAQSSGEETHYRASVTSAREQWSPSNSVLLLSAATTSPSVACRYPSMLTAGQAMADWRAWPSTALQPQHISMVPFSVLIFLTLIILRGPQLTESLQAESSGHVACHRAPYFGISYLPYLVSLGLECYFCCMHRHCEEAVCCPGCGQAARVQESNVYNMLYAVPRQEMAAKLPFHYSADNGLC